MATKIYRSLPKPNSTQKKIIHHAFFLNSLCIFFSAASSMDSIAYAISPMEEIMGLTRKQFIAKGRRFSVPKILAQGRVHVLLLRKYADELTAAGWAASDTDAFEQCLNALEVLYSSRSAETEASLKAAEIKASLRQNAKSLIRRIRLAAPIVIKKHSPEGITENAFNAKGKLGRSEVKVSKYLMSIRPFVKQLDELLKPYFGGKSAAAELETVKAALDKAAADHKASRNALPEETASIYCASGELLDRIEDANRSGHIAFDGRAEIASSFNKDLTLSIRRARKENTEESAQTAANV
jgi:hypothetical protein